MSLQSESLQRSDLVILDPDTLVSKYGPDKTALLLQSVLDETYSGESDHEDGHNPIKYRDAINNNTLFPFLILENEYPVASYTVDIIGAKARMGGAAVIPRLREQIRGKQLYLHAHQWVEENLLDRTEFISGNSRLPVSAAIAINDCGRFPIQWGPYASWGQVTEPHSSLGRRQEILSTSEKYPKNNVFIPDIIHMPSDIEIQKQIKLLWSEFSKYARITTTPKYIPEPISSFVPSDILSQYTVNIDAADQRKTIANISPRYSPTNTSLAETLKESFFPSTKSSLTLPYTRLLLLSLDPTESDAGLVQEALLQSGFTFAGIYPGLNSVEEIKKGNLDAPFFRQATHVFGVLRPNIIPTLAVPTVPILRNSQLREVAEAICFNWQINRLHID